MESTGSTSRRGIVIGLAAVLVLGAGFGIWKATGAGDGEEERTRGLGDYRCSDPSKAYYGNVGLIRRPAVVTSATVYDRIPEYQEIRSKGLTDTHTKYYFLMKKASERFTAAVKEAARSGRYDFVAETGTVHREEPDVDEPADITQAVVDALE